MEILLATFLLTTCLVFVCTLLLGLFRSSTKGEDQTVALELADKMLTQMALTDPALWPGIVSDPNILYTHDPSVQTEFRAEYRADPLPEPADTLGMGDLYDVTVRVYWWSDSGPDKTRSGYGRQTVSLSRVIYVETDPL